MNRSIAAKDLALFAELDMVYNQIRMLEAKQNKTKYKCLGSGNCCRIGLTLPLMECAHIAFRLRQKYYLVMEDKGEQAADRWFDNIVDNLLDAMYDEDWEIGGETKRHCVFWNEGCSIYEFRPMICRTVGTITTVDGFCPRRRNENGSIDYYSGPAVKKIVRQFQDLLERYIVGKDDGYDVSVYMPLGVLGFLLSNEEMVGLEIQTDPKFWKAVEGWFNYRISYTLEHGYDDEYLNEKAVKVGKRLLKGP